MRVSDDVDVVDAMVVVTMIMMMVMVMLMSFVFDLFIFAFGALRHYHPILQTIVHCGFIVRCQACDVEER